MSELERYATRREHEPGYSRNRRFDELSRPEALRLRRSVRRVEGLLREIALAEEHSLQPVPGGHRLILLFPSVRARREAHLTDDELALLRRLGEAPRGSTTLSAEEGPRGTAGDAADDGSS